MEVVSALVNVLVPLAVKAATEAAAREARNEPTAALPAAPERAVECNEHSHAEGAKFCVECGRSVPAARAASTSPRGLRSPFALEQSSQSPAVQPVSPRLSVPAPPRGPLGWGLTAVQSLVADSALLPRDSTALSMLSDECAFDWRQLDATNTMVDMDVVRILAVGSVACGKTQLCKTMLGDELQSDYAPTVFETYRVAVPLFRSVAVELWDMSGDARYDRKRGVVYGNVHAVLVCFDVASRASWEQCKRQWVPEARACRAGPLLLVGCKGDAVRVADADVLQRFTQLMQDVHQYAAQHCRDFKCVRVFVTSAATGDGLEEVFRTAVYATLFDVRARAINSVTGKLESVKQLV